MNDIETLSQAIAVAKIRPVKRRVVSGTQYVELWYAETREFYSPETYEMNGWGAGTTLEGKYGWPSGIYVSLNHYNQHHDTLNMNEVDLGEGLIIYEEESHLPDEDPESPPGNFITVITRLTPFVLEGDAIMEETLSTRFDPQEG